MRSLVDVLNVLIAMSHGGESERRQRHQRREQEKLGRLHIIQSHRHPERGSIVPHRHRPTAIFARQSLTVSL